MTNAVLTRPRLSVRSVATQLAISEKTVRRLVGRGELPALQVGGQLRIDPVEFTCWLYGWEPPPGYDAVGSTGAARSPRSWPEGEA